MCPARRVSLSGISPDDISFPLPTHPTPGQPSSLARRPQDPHIVPRPRRGHRRRRRRHPAIKTLRAGKVRMLIIDRRDIGSGSLPQSWGPSSSNHIRSKVRPPPLPQPPPQATPAYTPGTEAPRGCAPGSSAKVDPDPFPARQFSRAAWLP